MLSFIRLAVVAIVLIVVSQAAIATDAAASAPSPAGVQTISIDAMPLLLGQTSNSSSSGGSYRIPRGLIRLAIFGVIALFAAGAWVVRQLNGS